ncbi:MAG: glycoside hydrolase family 43 protein [Cyclobacteriaceae bacterium]
MKVQNPILKGFNPDPSIIRVGSDYYIATSTFEWFPGVQIHHSRDLANWTLVKRPLERKSQLDLLGVPDSCGVWAPCLSYADGIFYLVYSNVKSFDGPWKDTPNYLIIAKDILGDWSEPIFLDSRGFDASLFHDEDGRKWYVTLVVDHRQQRLFGGIEIQEIDPMSMSLKGPSYKIFEGTSLGCTEGPHLYKKDGYYYLITAEGGTEYHHAMTIARSRDITGPYEVHPQNPLITCKDNPEHPLQKSGHGDFVQAANGDWYIVFLISRPISERGRCILGRETAIEKVFWPKVTGLSLKQAVGFRDEY